MLARSRVVVGLGMMLLAAPVWGAVQTGGRVDEVVMGDKASEASHGLTGDHTEAGTGALGQPERRLLPVTPASFDGGWISFTVKVDPREQNYVTAKLWGSDRGQGAGRLVLYAEGLQVGYRHEGDYDVLNQCDDEGEAPGRFLYETLPLPPALTRGKTSITLKIAALGPMWAYGANFAQYQKNLTEPTRGIYRVYTHTERRFVPDASEKQGRMPEAGLRPGPGEEVIGESKKIVIERLNRLLEKTIGAEKGSQKDRESRLWLLAEAYNTAWTPAYHNPRAIEQIIADGDAIATKFAAKPDEAAAGWTGAGPVGGAVMLTWPAVRERLEEPVEVAGKRQSRREVWSTALRASVDFWRTHRRSYTNQSMIVDWNIYTANRGLELIDPEHALPEEHAKHFLYEAVGIEPWLGSDPRADQTPVADAPDRGATRPFGDSYCLVTKKGLSRELGWVGTYGETILHFMCDMVKMTGDEKIRQQLAKLERARMYFRYPGLDAEGYRCMKLVSEVDNRTAHYPVAGGAYTAPNIREEWWMDVPALLSGDPVAVGAAQRSLADHEYFAYVQGRLKDPDTLGMMRNVEEYAKVKALPSVKYEFPMAEGKPDFAFADEEDAIVALKHGETRLFVNLYYRSERGVNGVARVWEGTPTMTRIATVRTETQVEESGHMYTRPDWIDGIRGKGMPPPGEVIHQAWAGDVMPVAARPADAKIPAYGDWGPFLGKAEFYTLKYGDYLILMNSSEKKEFPCQVPAEFANGRDLVSGKAAGELAGKPMRPLSTVILYAGKGDER